MCVFGVHVEGRRLTLMHIQQSVRLVSTEREGNRGSRGGGDRAGRGSKGEEADGAEREQRVGLFCLYSRSLF